LGHKQGRERSCGDFQPIDYTKERREKEGMCAIRVQEFLGSWIRLFKQLRILPPVASKLSTLLCLDEWLQIEILHYFNRTPSIRV
jgi:hypothetical protein